jgi:hypothetical protein
MLTFRDVKSSLFLFDAFELLHENNTNKTIDLLKFYLFSLLFFFIIIGCS